MDLQMAVGPVTIGVLVLVRTAAQPIVPAGHTHF
jgi:hypothetical protein